VQLWRFFSVTKRNPTRATVEGRAYLDLQNLAKRTGRPTDELFQLYALEGFLARLAASEFADRLVLKGGVLLAAFDNRRPTRDVDLFARDLSNDIEAILARVKAICAQPLDDGLQIDPDSARAGVIRDEHEYSGVRIAVRGTLSVARIDFHIDINVGDPVWPAPGLVALPKILGGSLDIMGYPLAMVYAEKTLTMLERGLVNTRWRDFTDVYTLSRTRTVDGSELHKSLTTVAAHRGLVVRPLAVALVELPGLAQNKWSVWRRKQSLQDRVPEQFSEVLNRVSEFTDPVLNGAVSGTTWDPEIRSWS
jgi:predicted nucleotidyltransferase component of viral defense system